MGLSYEQQTMTTTTTTTTTNSLFPHFHAGEQQKPASSGNMTTSTNNTTKAPNLHELLGPLLPALQAAAVSAQPAEAVLPHLSPILRQRVQLLSSTDGSQQQQQPWLELLCYDQAKAARLREAVAQSDRLELHPVSGEVEVDWDCDAEARYRRLDEETLQALVALRDVGLSFQLVYCTGDPAAGDAWKVGEVSVVEKPSPFSSFGGAPTIAEAERQFGEKKKKQQQQQQRAPAPAVLAPATNGYSYSSGSHHLAVGNHEDEEDDDDYWARYDATPSRTPAVTTPAIKRSPAPQSTNGYGLAAEEDYYAQYDTVQPAMDNYDPDEEANNGGLEEIAPPPPLGLARPVGGSEAASNGSNSESEAAAAEANEMQGSWTLAEPVPQSPPSSSLSPSNHSRSRSGEQQQPPPLGLVHPRPASSASSRASVERLEAAAEKRDQGEFGVKQHVSRSVKSLYMLSRASGIDRQEFERLVRTELDMLGLMED